MSFVRAQVRVWDGIIEKCDFFDATWFVFAAGSKKKK